MFDLSDVSEMLYYSSPGVQENGSTQCPLCLLCFKSEYRLAKDKTNKIFRKKDQVGMLSSCQYFKYCSKCGQTVNRFFSKKDRIYQRDCDKTHCDFCKTYAVKLHYCYMKNVDFTKRKDRDVSLYFFDFETRAGVDTRLFIPHYCVVERVCKQCEMIPFKKDGYQQCTLLWKMSICL